MPPKKSTTTPKSLYEWQDHIMSATGPPALARLALMALMVHMGTDTLQCYPSLTTVAIRTGLSRRSVIRFLQQAEIMGWIEIARGKKANGRNRPNIYRATMPAAPKMVTNSHHHNSAPQSLPDSDRQSPGGDPQALDSVCGGTGVVSVGHPNYPPELPTRTNPVMGAPPRALPRGGSPPGGPTRGGRADAARDPRTPSKNPKKKSGAGACDVSVDSVRARGQPERSKKQHGPSSSRAI